MGEVVVVVVKEETGRVCHALLDVLVGLAEWAHGTRTSPASAVCVAAERLCAAETAWKVTLNAAGDPFSLVDLRRLAWCATVGDAMRESSAFLRPYLVKSVGAESTLTFSPIDHTETHYGEGSAVHMGNEIVFCFAGLVNEMRQNDMARLQELASADLAPNSFLRIAIDGTVVACEGAVLSSSNTCWVGKSSYLRLRLSLYSGRQCCASLAVYNGRAPLTGPADEALLEALQQGLQTGKAAILLRMQREQEREWRHLGEWQQLGGDAHQSHSLVITAAMFAHDGSELDGTNLTSDWMDRVAKCAASVSTGLTVQIAERAKARRKIEEQEAVRQVLAAETGELFSAIVNRGRPAFVERASEHIADMAYHGESVAVAITRVIKEATQP